MVLLGPTWPPSTRPPRNRSPRGRRRTSSRSTRACTTTTTARRGASAGSNRPPRARRSTARRRRGSRTSRRAATSLLGTPGARRRCPERRWRGARAGGDAGSNGVASRLRCGSSVGESRRRRGRRLDIPSSARGAAGSGTRRRPQARGSFLRWRKLGENVEARRPGPGPLPTRGSRVGPAPSWTNPAALVEYALAPLGLDGSGALARPADVFGGQLTLPPLKPIADGAFLEIENHGGASWVESGPPCSRRADRSLMNRGDAAAAAVPATRLRGISASPAAASPRSPSADDPGRRVAATPRPGRGYSDESRRRDGQDADLPRRRVAGTAAASLDSSRTAGRARACFSERPLLGRRTASFP